MEVSPVTKTSRRLFWQLKFIRVWRHAPQTNLNFVTVQFFLAIPIAFRLFGNNQTTNEMNTNVSFDNSSFSFISHLANQLYSAGNLIGCYRRQFVDILSSQKWMNQVKVLATERPVTFSVVCVGGLLTALPLLAVLFVAAMAVIVSFLAFVIVEGTLLTIGTMFVGVTLCVAACIAFPVAAFLGIVYLSMSFIMQLYCSISEILKQLFITREEADAAALHRVRYMSGSMSPTRPMVPTCITDSDAILSRRIAANGHAKHVQYDYYPVGFPVRCMGTNGDSCMADTAECG